MAFCYSTTRTPSLSAGQSRCGHSVRHRQTHTLGVTGTAEVKVIFAVSFQVSAADEPNSGGTFCCKTLQRGAADALAHARWSCSSLAQQASRPPVIDQVGGSGYSEKKGTQVLAHKTHSPAGRQGRASTQSNWCCAATRHALYPRTFSCSATLSTGCTHLLIDKTPLRAHAKAIHDGTCASLPDVKAFRQGGHKHLLLAAVRPPEPRVG